MGDLGIRGIKRRYHKSYLPLIVIEMGHGTGSYWLESRNVNTSLAALPGVTTYSTLTVNVSPSCSFENTKAVLSPARECSAQ